MSQWIGLAMLAGVALGAMATDLPVCGVLISLATFGAAASVMLDASSAAVLAALPSRLVGLLESDLLQALPLFVFMGALLNRLALARILFRAALRPFGGAPGATLALGAILGPMNGSVSANAIAPLRAVMAALAPFILVQLFVTAAVICWPDLAHWGRAPAPAAVAPSEAEVARRLREIARPADLLEIAPPKF